MNRWVLLNPGPVNVTERVRRSLLGPDICHREEEFSDLLKGVRQKLLSIFGISSTHTVAVFTGSGTTALEAMLCSFGDAKKKTLVLSNGIYGERIRSILALHEIPHRAIEGGAGSFPALEEIESALREDPSIESIAMVHHETSTGMLNPLSAVATLAKKYKKFFLVDAVSSLGAEPVHFKKDSIDLCAGTSGKCLHGFPGISFVILSKKAKAALQKKKPRSLSLDLSGMLKFSEENGTAFTPAVQTLYAFNEALEELKKQGLQARIRLYRKKSKILQQGIENLGLRFLVEKPSRSHVLTAVWTPASIAYHKLHDRLKKEGFVIYAGQSALQGKIFRVSNLGDVSIPDLRRFLRRLGKILSEK